MQKKYNSNLNINITRKKNRRDIIRKWFKLVILFLILLFFLFYIWEGVVKPKLIEKDSSKFPISTESDLKLSLEKTEKGFCLLNRNKLNFYSKDGSKINSLDCNLGNPAISCCKKFAVIYDRNGKVCSLNNFEINLCNKMLEDNILSAKVAENGNFVIVTGSESAFCQLHVFNKKGDKIFKWSSSKNLIIDFDFNQDGTGCFICTLCVDENGLEKTIIYSLDFQQNKEISKKILNDTSPISIKVTNSGVGLICANSFYFLDSNCSVIKSLKFQDDWDTFYLSDRSYYIFAFKNNLLIYDRFVNLLGQLKFNELVKKIKLIGKYIFVLVNENLYICNLRLKIIKTIELNKLADDFFCEDKYGYFLFNNVVEKFKIF